MYSTLSVPGASVRAPPAIAARPAPAQANAVITTNAGTRTTILVAPPNAGGKGPSPSPSHPFTRETALYAIPAALNAPRTFAGFSGDCRTRTPVASKTAFATADPIAAVGGSPEPDSCQPSLNALVLPAVTSVSNAPGTTTLYSLGWTLINVTDGE